MIQFLWKKDDIKCIHKVAWHDLQIITRKETQYSKFLYHKLSIFTLIHLEDSL